MTIERARVALEGAAETLATAKGETHLACDYCAAVRCRLDSALFQVRQALFTLAAMGQERPPGPMRAERTK